MFCLSESPRILIWKIVSWYKVQVCILFEIWNFKYLKHSNVWTLDLNTLFVFCFFKLMCISPIEKIFFLKSFFTPLYFPYPSDLGSTFVDWVPRVIAWLVDPYLYNYCLITTFPKPNDTCQHHLHPRYLAMLSSLQLYYGKIATSIRCATWHHLIPSLFSDLAISSRWLPLGTLWFTRSRTHIHV